ncbi:hypothetical protein ACGFYT_29910 [Streptomyces sp. NPDC048208]|uniref:hypothetical protein n=1 Tax=Streptomyces sp. NPDC048208 TaxID=3365515 RepID=UPI0037208248
MNATTACTCTTGALADMCRANRRETGIRYYLGQLDAFAASVRAGEATMYAIDDAIAMSEELIKLRDSEERCVSAR